MIKILQYGEGNFLRTFVDAYFDNLNKNEGGMYEVNIVKPITFGTLERFEKQKNKYHIILRGQKDGKAVEDVYKIDSLANVIDPFVDMDSYIALAKDKDLKIIVSNTTEAGICYHDTDKMEGFEDVTYPAKLTKFLFERFNAGLDGVYLLPVELIDNNADELYRCVDKYIKLWNLPTAFKKWNDEQNFYCNTLVDRIVSGYPRDEQTKAHLTELIGEVDELMSVGEPFGLWAVEDKGEVAKYIQEGVHNIEVVLTKDIKYYKKRKVRVLNGSHTNLVPAGIVLGAQTVYDCMVDEKLHAFLIDTLDEIIPFVSDDIAATKVFADAVVERFFNPYLNHQLWSIALNSISKWVARDLPSFQDYYKKNGKIPAKMTVGFSYLIYLYQTRLSEIKDDAWVLEKFARISDVKTLMADTQLWGEDLTKYEGFADTVAANVAKISKGEVLI